MTLHFNSSLDVIRSYQSCSVYFWSYNHVINPDVKGVAERQALTRCPDDPDPRDCTLPDGTRGSVRTALPSTFTTVHDTVTRTTAHSAVIPAAHTVTSQRTRTSTYKPPRTVLHTTTLDAIQNNGAAATGETEPLLIA